MSTSAVNPGRVHQALTSYQLAQAMKGALELEIFTHIMSGAKTASAIALLCGGTEKGVRVLCDYLTVHGFLTKSGQEYAVMADVASLLDRNSPAYMGSVADFFLHPVMVAKYNDVAGLVRRGGAVDHTLEPNEQIWVEFARNMAPMFAMQATKVAQKIARPGEPIRVLDIAAGHGLFGIHIALANPAAQVMFQDWANVLEVARENTAKMGVGSQAQFLPGSAFDVEFGTAFDVVLLPNFLHHFDRPTNVALLRKVRAALKPGGMVAVIEFVPNEDRVTPPDGAMFAMRMLGTTPNGDAYTLAEIDAMLQDAGFSKSEAHSLAPAHQQLITATA